MFVCPACGQRYDRAGYCAADGQPLDRTDDPMLGTVIDRYRLARRVGEGGMGRVYLAVQPAIGSRVAIKILSDDCRKSPELVERFFDEARAVNLIRHENITNVLDMAVLPDGRPYIVMEFVEGQTLADLVRDKQAPLGGVFQVVSEVLSALAAAHAIGIVHRDLKPDNILVTVEGHAKVLDFGIAKLAPGLRDLGPQTKTGAILGTPAYMAPEQISGASKVDARSDLYAIGVVLFEAVTGRAPFSGATLFDLMKAHVEQPPPSPRALRPDLPPAIEQVILTALAKDPQQRFQSAAAMAQALAYAAGSLAQEQWRPLSSRGGVMTPRLSAGGMGAQPTPRTPADRPMRVSDAPPTRPLRMSDPPPSGPGGAPTEPGLPPTGPGGALPIGPSGPGMPIGASGMPGPGMPIGPSGEQRLSAEAYRSTAVSPGGRTEARQRRLGRGVIIAVAAALGFGVTLLVLALGGRDKHEDVALGSGAPMITTPTPANGSAGGSAIAPGGATTPSNSATAPAPGGSTSTPTLAPGGSASTPTAPSGSATAPSNTTRPATHPAPASTGSATTPHKHGPTIVNGGSAADHGVFIGSNVEIGDNVIIGSQTPPKDPTGAPKSVTKPADYDAKHFDPVAYLPKAEALAKTLAPDAHLTRFEFDPVFADGHVDLTMAGRDHEYDFRSVQRSARPADVPRNVPVERPCMIHVEIEPTRVVATVRTTEDCDARLVRYPRCHFAGVWARATAPHDLVARIAWLSDEQWFFDIDLEGKGGGVSTIPDRCP